jgi:hypothetical protein
MSFDSVLAGSKGLRGKRNGTRTKLAGISGSRIFKTVANRGFAIPQSDQETSIIETEVRQLFSHQICPNILQV